MTHREARSGAAIAGAILCAMPLADMLFDPGRSGPLHLVVDDARTAPNCKKR